MPIRDFVPYFHDAGHGVPHHASDRDPGSLQDAIGKNRNGLAEVEVRLMDISKALSRVGMNEIASQIWSEAQDICYFREMMDRAISKDLDEKVKNADSNSVGMVKSALAGVELAGAIHKV